MDNLKLNKQQIQAAVDQLTSQPEGVNKLMEIALNNLMKAERSTYLESAKTGNKANGYRAVNGLSIGDSLSLQVPRDRLGQFKPWLLNAMKDQSESLNELCFELYTKGLTTRDIESITQSIYGTVCNVESVLTLLSKVAIDMNSSTYRHPVSRLIKSDLFN